MRDRLASFLPGAVQRNREYLPVLVPIVLLWGGLVATGLVAIGQDKVAQFVVDVGTISVISVGVLSFAVGGFKKTGQPELIAGLTWSAVGVPSVILVSAVAVVVSVLLDLALSPFGLEKNEIALLTIPIAGLGGTYLWYRLNRWGFSQIKSWAQSSFGENAPLEASRQPQSEESRDEVSEGKSTEGESPEERSSSSEKKGITRQPAT